MMSSGADSRSARSMLWTTNSAVMGSTAPFRSIRAMLARAAGRSTKTSTERRNTIRFTGFIRFGGFAGHDTTTRKKLPNRRLFVRRDRQSGLDGSLLLRVVRRAYQRTSFHVPKAERPAVFAKIGEFLRGIEPIDGKMVSSGLEILSQGKNLD